MHLACESLTHAGIGPVLVALPACQQGAGNSIKARTVHLEIAPKRPIQEALRILPRNRGMLEIEFELAVNVGVIHIRQHAPFLYHLLIEWRTRNRRVEHELMEVSS